MDPTPGLEDPVIVEEPLVRLPKPIPNPRRLESPHAKAVNRQ